MCLMDAVQLDTTHPDAFAERMLDILNHGALALMISLGHRTELFDTLATLPPADSGAIANAANLDERYVREWLAAMVTGGIITYDPATGHYDLPPAHAAFLTRAAKPNNLAAPTQFLPVLASVEDRLVDCFYHGGGVPYEAFNRFHAVMAEESDQTVGAALFDSILPLAPVLIDRLEEGIEVLDIGCGSGHTLTQLADAFPRSRFRGYDLCPDAIAAARRQAEALQLDNVQFDIQDVARIEERERYDLITAFDAIHDQAAPAKVLGVIQAALKDDGTFLMQDISGSSRLEKNLDHPLGTMLFTISCMHCMTVSLAQGGAGLGAMWGRELAVQMLREAGFQHVAEHELPHDAMNVFFVAHKNARN